MSAEPLPESLSTSPESWQQEQAADDVHRYVWKSCFGVMRVEVRAGKVCVEDDHFEPFKPQRMAAEPSIASRPPPS